MATISNPTLVLGQVTNNLREVTVSADVMFDRADEGKTYKLEIALFGEDKSGDALPPGDSVGDNLLYTFSWAAGPIFLTKAYKLYTVTRPGPVKLQEKRMVSVAALDEDAGVVLVPGPINGHLIPLPRKDEVYAQIKLSVPALVARTPTIVAGGMV